MEKVDKRGKISFPHTCALLFIITIIAAILTWIIPAGEYEYEVVDGITKVVAGTYHTIEKTPQGIWDIFLAVVEGFSKASVTINMILFVGAAVFILEETKSIDVAFKGIAGSKANKPVIIFGVMLFMSIGGAAGVFANPVVALVPIGIILSKALGLDAATGFLMVYLGAYSGFNVGWANASTLGVAHPIAELPLFSGFGVRVIFHIVNFIITYLFIMRYVKKIESDPTKSLNYDGSMDISGFMGNDTNKNVDNEDTRKFGVKDAINFGATSLAIASILFGSIKFNWGNKEISAAFLILSIFLGLYNGYGVNGTTQLFIKGCASMLGAAFIVGFANAISVVLSNGQILNTIVHALSIPISKAGATGGAAVMFLANMVINLFIPSGSGQAATVMPIMIPIADLVGITRQVAVQAFQFGDGFSNCVIPTAGTIMGCLGIAGISWNKYAKWIMPLLILQTVLGIIALVVLQSIGWMGI